MKWSDVRLVYPEQWLVVEALAAHTTEDSYRVPDNLAVLESCVDGHAAMQRYRVLHQAYPEREFYYVHTSRETRTVTCTLRGPLARETGAYYTSL